uniref:(northern house mosquito) hypothetical protein n=1 Tax=Culex pipiens TaxID=7175 RepID=A0A8D8GKQ3_CULPI
MPTLMLRYVPNSVPQRIITSRVAPMTTPFQMYRPNTLKTGSTGLNSTFMMEKLADAPAKAVAKPRKITVVSQRPALMNSSRGIARPVGDVVVSTVARRPVARGHSSGFSPASMARSSDSRRASSFWQL